MFHKISERVEDEYGDGDKNSITDNIEPAAIISFLALLFIIVYAALSP